MSAINAVAPVSAVDHIRRQRHHPPAANTKNYRLVYRSRKQAPFDFYSGSESMAPYDAARQLNVDDLEDVRVGADRIERISDGHVIWRSSVH